MRIGNWKVGEDGIEWVGQFADNYYIEPHRMTKQGSGERSQMYEWLIEVADKYWTTKKDVYDVDAAFIQAVLRFKLNFDPRIFAKTLYEQSRIMEYTMRH